jgi:hypothetical protein
MRPTSRSLLQIVAPFTLLCLLVNPISLAANDVNVNGKSLKHLGEGLREFLWVDIYKMNAYSESGSCKPTDIVYKNETKMLSLKMIRSIPKDRLTSNLRSTFEDNLPKKGDVEGLKKKIDSFLSMFKKDLNSGTVVDIVYSPGQGTIIKEKGKQVGKATPGKDFADLVWRSYFGGNTCCKSLKLSILEACRKK